MRGYLALPQGGNTACFLYIKGLFLFAAVRVDQPLPALVAAFVKFLDGLRKM
jgi:hypothetical protein